MKAGFARVSITPPMGTAMMGFGTRDREHGCRGVHDDIFVRALFLEHGGEQALIMGFDLCFLGREESDRYKGAIGRRMDVLPRQIMLNTSHTHTGTAVGPWCYGAFRPQDALYLQDIEDAVLNAALHAADTAQDVAVRAGMSRTALPMNRRRNEDGEIFNAPNPGGLVCDALPVTLFENAGGEPVALLFSVSCHPSIVSGFDISADYPGVAMAKIDAHLGGPCSLFLQGAGGNAKPKFMDSGKGRWPVGTWDMVQDSGELVADEVIQSLGDGTLAEIEPEIRSASVESAWPLQPAPDRFEFERVIAEGRLDHKRLWAERQIQRIDRGETLATHAPVTVQGVQLGKGLRLIGVEGELTAPHGIRIIETYKDGVTFPLGYVNGTGLYLVTSDMLDEGGMEVTSYLEYGFPAPLARGMEEVLRAALQEVRAMGVE